MKRLVLMCLLAAAAWGISCSAGYAAEAGGAPLVPAKYAVLHQGAYMQVGGVVCGVYHAAGLEGAPTFINLEQPYPHDPFFIIIWQGDREKFPAGFFDALSGQAITVTGPIGRTEKSGKGFITVTEPAQISLVNTIIPMEEAKLHIGNYVRLQGLLAEVKERPNQSGMPTYLNFERPYPEHQLLGIIWEPNRAAFGDLAEMKGKVVLVSGIVEEGPDGRPFVQLAAKSQLSARSE